MSNAIKILLPSAISFITGILLTPVLTHYFYKYRMWKNTSRNENVAPGEFQKIHDAKAELSTPRTGGMVVWMSVLVTLFLLLVINLFNNSIWTEKLYFISRGQTLLPLFTLIIASLVGLGDDFIQIFGKGKWKTDPIVLRFIKIGIILLIGVIIGWWFYSKLGVTTVYIPMHGFVNLGFLFIPFFILVMLAVWSSSVIDGIDGLSGGVMASIFAAYTFISFFHGQIDLAAFCAVVTGGILAFLWFNIPPARFYMGETGMMGLTVTLAVVAFLTNTVFLLPVIALPLFATSLSDVIQMTSRKFRNGKKVFLFAPLHHHFEALGWPKYKVVMRYWIVGVISAIIGVILSLVS
jgi:phospho-N-acetylmuramoyl-pentapeptide-transferase